MIPTRNGGGLQDDSEGSFTSNGTTDVFKANADGTLHISTSRKGLFGDGSPHRENYKKLTFLPKKFKLMQFNPCGSLGSPSSKFRQIAEEREGGSRSVPSSTILGFRKRFNGIVVQKIDWVSIRKICGQWIKNPLNMALLLWISCVAVSGGILFLVLTGMLNSVLPKKSQRNAWFEVNNQILNALFTLMCLYQHPKRFYHLVLLCRWKPKDITTLREVYCKNGTYKPREWAHMMVVVVLLHVNCFAQYALCVLNLGYKRSERPAVGVGICISIAIATPAIAGLYSIVSPLGKEYEADEEAQDQICNNSSGRSSCQRLSSEKRFSFAPRNEQNFVENAPEWRGGLFDFWDNLSVAYLSLFCSFCVFGWNMERLGFGNMYVHIATFLLFCTAPFWIFNLAAVNIDNEAVREVLVLTGVVLCMFGLLYGGFWRIQMRKRFNLPANKFCFGNPATADCTQWLFCCWCSLAQEVRTADFYEIVEDKFDRKQTYGYGQRSLSPLPREDGAAQFRSFPTSPLRNSPRLSNIWTEKSPSPSRPSKEYYSPGRHLPKVEEFSGEGKDKFMEAPVPLSSRMERDTNNRT